MTVADTQQATPGRIQQGAVNDRNSGLSSTNTYDRVLPFRRQESLSSPFIVPHLKYISVWLQLIRLVLFGSEPTRSQRFFFSFLAASGFIYRYFVSFLASCRNVFKNQVKLFSTVSNWKALQGESTNVAQCLYVLGNTEIIPLFK